MHFALLPGFAHGGQRTKLCQMAGSKSC